MLLGWACSGHGASAVPLSPFRHLSRGAETTTAAITRASAATGAGRVSRHHCADLYDPGRTNAPTDSHRIRCRWGHAGEPRLRLGPIEPHHRYGFRVRFRD